MFAINTFRKRNTHTYRGKSVPISFLFPYAPTYARNTTVARSADTVVNNDIRISVSKTVCYASSAAFFSSITPVTWLIVYSGNAFESSDSNAVIVKSIFLYYNRLALRLTGGKNLRIIVWPIFRPNPIQRMFSRNTTRQRMISNKIRARFRWRI